RPGFSILEVLVALAILSIIMLVILKIITETGRAWKSSSAKIEAFQSARMAFETMNRSLGQATLNTYYDYYDATRNKRTNTNSATFVPDVYGRYSELQFISGKSLVTTPRQQVSHSVFFQTPLGYSANSGSYGQLEGLLNSVGFYIEFNSDQADRPSFFSALPGSSSKIRYRYRLMQMLQPSEQLSTYSVTDTSWFTGPINSGSPPTRLLAENILACVIYPHMPGDTTGTSAPAPTPAPILLTGDYEYNTRVAWTSGAQPPTMNQLPPLVEVVLIAADEISMLRVQGTSTTQPSLGFDYSSVFQIPANLDADIQTVSQALISKHVKFRVFRRDIVIRQAHWSQ
ncbi:MAG: competence system putative prepilin ComGE, partial [Methylacidiphilales bacterium]|nr:competence system putative prepilin ComGE [Candidatus Methylacidiphilales bacterium]